MACPTWSRFVATAIASTASTVDQGKGEVSTVTARVELEPAPLGAGLAGDALPVDARGSKSPETTSGRNCICSGSSSTMANDGMSGMVGARELASVRSGRRWRTSGGLRQGGGVGSDRGVEGLEEWAALVVETAAGAGATAAVVET